MIISTDTEQAFHKIQYPFMIKKKTLNKPEIEGNFLKLRKGICENSIAIIFHGERLNAFLHR